LKNNKIDTIVFDLGGVLVDWNPRYVYQSIFKTTEAVEYFLSSVCTNHWNELQDAGRSFADGTKWLTNIFPEYSNEIAAYYGRWVEMLKGQINETVDILSDLKFNHSYRLYALTNWSAESFPVAYKRFEFLHWFEGILVSGAENLKKPDPAIFHLLLERYSIQSENTIFIDDNRLNIEAARILGFQTILYINSTQYREELSLLLG